MNKEKLGFRVGLILAGLHFALLLVCFFSALGSRSSTAGLAFIPFFFLDAPIFLIFPQRFLELMGAYGPLVEFGVFGSLVWLIIPWLTGKIFNRVFPRTHGILLGVAIFGSIALTLVGFSRLGRYTVSHLMQGERPAELKNSLNSTSSNFLREKAIFVDPSAYEINSINEMKCRPEAGTEIIFGLPQGIAFLNQAYGEQKRIPLIKSNGAYSIEPVPMGNGQPCGYLVYVFMKSVHLFDGAGKELWKFDRVGKNKLPMDDAKFGDINGDGKPEFAVQYAYGDGIHLLDLAGKERWAHPVGDIGHMEVADVTGKGNSQVVFTGSVGIREGMLFTALDEKGAVAKRWIIPSPSTEFAVVRWPDAKGKPNLILTEDGKIRVVEMDGKPKLELEAPGCRLFGKFRAVTVKFHKDLPEYLAVRKSLHPDLSVLYVYDNKGKLVFQKTEVIVGAMNPVLKAVPAEADEAEKLLVGAMENNTGKVVEFSLAQPNH